MKIKDSVYQFRVALEKVEPEVWRRIVVPGTYSFWDLHVAIQDSMGWDDYHLHLFRIRDPESGEMDQIGIPFDTYGEGPEIFEGWELPIAEYFLEPGDHALYEYDFGDGWQHHVELEEITPRVGGKKYPVCLGGERACPPEDCGGPWGYADFLEAVSDSAHEEHARMLEWVGGKFDPSDFSPQKVRFDDPDKRWQYAFEEDGT
ncbi:MAG TPA: plasmid pRiA4b ORF-3 family protein [Acidobacteriota bacterium]|nr:plasmid pRiA4b ORF-3 family protein [Acidobacteriota bacterium]